MIPVPLDFQTCLETSIWMLFRLKISKIPFENESFDVTISNTVAEHIEPSRFYGEQYRVLKLFTEKLLYTLIFLP